MRIANGRTKPAELTLDIANAGPAPQFSVLQTRLFAGEEQAQSCLGDASTSPVELARASGRRLTLTIPRCRAFVLTQELPTSQAEFRLGLLGSIDVNDDELEALIDSINESEPGWDFILLGGDVRVRHVSNVPETLRRAIEASDVPIGIVLGELEIERGYTDFLDRFGATDYVVPIGAGRLLVLDTASRTLTSRQLDFLDSIRGASCNDECPPGAAVMWASPVGPTNADRGGFSSEFVAQAVIQRLDERQFDQLFASSARSRATTSLAGLTSYQLAEGADVPGIVTVRFDTRRASESACYDRQFSSASSVVIPGTTRYRCTESQTCVEGLCEPRCLQPGNRCGEPSHRCVDGRYCLATCRSDDDCDADAGCVESVCRPEPAIRIER